MTNNDNKKRMFEEVDKITSITKNRIKWLTISTILSFTITIVTYYTFNYSNDIYVTILLIIFMLGLVSASWIANKSYNKKMKIIKEFKF